MIMECTNCSNCANFSDGFRLYCLHPDLPCETVCEYNPIGCGDARKCEGFDEGEPHDFSWDDMTIVEAWSIVKYGEESYASIKEWCLMRIQEGHQ